jgi:3-dehydroquinate dehydratase-1
MPKIQRKALLPAGWSTKRNVVATAHTTIGLRMAAKLDRRTADFVEVRFDLLPANIPPAALTAVRLPLLLTARHRAEGGGRDWLPGERAKLLEPLLPFAAAMDWEWNFVHEARDFLQEAKAFGIALVLSFHDFNATPPASKLLRMRDRALAAGADVFKIATLLRNTKDLCNLLAVQEKSQEMPVALMGMGPLGRGSRLLLAAGGSVLNYGWLHRPQVPGQYPAMLLRERIREVCE